jgi:UDP-N-acetylmuramoyl-tripeptide--D-alanyl-D-alanine ligase
LVNNAQREHQEFMATVEAVALENGQVILALADDGVAVFPSDDTYTPLWRGLAAGRRVMTFSDTDPAADVAGVKADWQGGAWTLCFATPAGKGTVHLKIAGRHNVRNALAATACALAAGVKLDAVVRGLDAFVPVGGRSRALALRLDGRTITLIDDTYNANPDSVRAAIDVLAELPGPRLLVLGDMGEVGEQGLAFHEEVLRHARDRGVEAVHVAGDWMRQAAPVWPAVTHWNEVPAMAGAVCAAVTDDRPVFHSVLVKGSRFMRTERVVDALLALDPTQHNNKKDNAHAA